MADLRNNSQLRLVTYNCRSVKNTIGVVKNLCLTNDIIFLQEHWLFPYELEFLSSISDDFYAYGASSVEINSDIVTGRPYGGTAILYRKCLNTVIKFVKTDNPRITAVTLNTAIDGQKTPMLLASVYMPVSCPDTDSDFEFICGLLNALILECDVNSFVLVGDFNFSLNSQRHDIFMNILNCHKVFCVDSQCLDDDSFTFVSDCHNTTSWIDHVFTNTSLLPVFQDMSVIYDVVASDHRPLQFAITVNVSPENVEIDTNNPVTIADWKSSNEHDHKSYQLFLCNLLQSVHVPRCFKSNCCEVSHCRNIDLYYSEIIECLHKATSQCIPSKRVKASHYCVAGWNDLVEEKHQAARRAFRAWVVDGKDRIGFIYEMMKITRAKFKLALRYCKANEEMMRCDALAFDHLSNTSNFWKNVKKSTNSKATKFATCINEAIGETNIANMWRDNYEKLYNTHDNAGVYNFSQNIVSVNANDVNDIMLSDVCKAMVQLKSGKAHGPDGISPEAVKHGGILLAVYLKLLFNMFLAHSYLPESMIMTTLVPLLKNKSGDMADVNNYRAIALSNATSKIIENIILERFQSVDQESDPCQFGFRKDHSTTLACSVLKNVIDYYRLNGSHVFACFLDMSKAFDMVNHNKLFKMLVSLNFPTRMVKLLIYWYSNQMVNVRWKSTITSSFVMRNGTRQGSILSPYLFSVYMRDISFAINRSGHGCHMADVPCNIIFYADDMVILAPSWHSLQLLLDLCSTAVASLDMNFNVGKSVAMIFSPVNTNRRLFCVFENFRLGKDNLQFVESFKYLGHSLTNDLYDDKDMMKQMGLLYCRTNVLIRKFVKCSVKVKLSLFRAYCINFFGMSLWNKYRKTTVFKIEAAYVKCVKMFFCYDRLFSVTQMFLDLGLPTFKTLMYNAMHNFKNSCIRHVNHLVLTVHETCVGYSNC